MKRIVTMGIDQSITSTGYCVVDGGGVLLDYGTLKTKSNKEDPMDVFYRVAYISDQLMDIITRFDVTHVNIEGLSFGAPGSSNRQLAGLQHVIIDRILNMEVELDIQIIAPKQLKRKATASGNASKDDMVASLPDDVYNIFITIPKHSRYDLADAYHLAVFSDGEKQDEL